MVGGLGKSISTQLDAWCWNRHFLFLRDQLDDGFGTKTCDDLWDKLKQELFSRLWEPFKGESWVDC